MFGSLPTNNTFIEVGGRNEWTNPDNTFIEVGGGNEWTNEKSLPHTGEG